MKIPNSLFDHRGYSLFRDGFLFGFYKMIWLLENFNFTIETVCKIWYIDFVMNFMYLLKGLLPFIRA